jgi:hypothetical protein
MRFLVGQGLMGIPFVHETEHPAFYRYRESYPRRMDHREIAVRVPVMNEVQFLFASEPCKPLKPRHAAAEGNPRSTHWPTDWCRRSLGTLNNELADKGFLVTATDELITWARTGSLMWMTFGLACCAIESTHTTNTA